MPKHRNAAKLAGIDTSLHYRAVPLAKAADGTPATLDEKTRSVEIVASTEAPVMTFDYDRWELVPEVLLMSGCQVPGTRQVPLLDTHMRYNTASVIGSVRGLEVKGSELVGRAHYSTAPEADGPYLKMTEGHLTDYSVGYRYDKKDAVYIPEGETGIVDGRTFTGPVKVVRKWQVKETSACPIGADEFAKARAATAPHSPHAEENDMDPKLRTFLEGRGLKKDATEEEAWRFLETLNVRSEPAPATPPAPAAPAKTEDEIRTEAIRSEQVRITEIRSICGRAGIDEAKITEYITTSANIEDVRKAAFDHVTTQTQQGTEKIGFRAQVGTDERDKFRAAGQDALILRAGLRHDPAKLAQGALDLRGYSMVEMARECLRMSGQPFGGDAMTMVGRALTTSDFPTLLGNVANLSLMEGWAMAGETWEQWADGSGSVANFLTHTMARAGETDDLDEVGEEGEYKYGSNSEQAETYQIATYGKLTKISRQAIINDQLGAIADAFARRGEAAARKVGDVAYAVLTANAAMGDNIALFHADHGNLGTTGAISETTMAEMVKLLGLQKDINGKRRLNIPLQFILAPKSIEGYAEVFFNSMQFTGDTKASTRANPYAGTKYARVYEPRLDDDSTTAWYGLGPKGKTVKLFFLNGNRTPYLETKEGWHTDGVEFKTRIDVGAKAVDWRGMAKNAGA